MEKIGLLEIKGMEVEGNSHSFFLLLSSVSFSDYLISKIFDLVNFFISGLVSLIGLFRFGAIIQYILNYSTLFVNSLINWASWFSVANVIKIISSMDPRLFFLLELILLLASFILFLQTRRYRASKAFAVDYTPGFLLIIVAIIPLVAALIALPSNYTFEYISDWSNLTDKRVSLSSPEAEKLNILVPRERSVTNASINISPNIVANSSPLIELKSTNRTTGYPLSCDFVTSYKFQLNRSYALGRMSFYLAPIGDCDPDSDLTVRGYIGDSNELAFDCTKRIGSLDNEGEWLDVKIQPSFLHLNGQKLRITLTVEDGFYVWWMSVDRFGGSVKVLERGSGWRSVSGEPCFELHTIDKYESQVSVDAGLEGIDWKENMTSHSSFSLEISDDIQEYLPLSPENFENISVPLRFYSQRRMDLVINSVHVVVTYPNPGFILGVISIFLGAISSSLMVYSGLCRFVG